MVEQVHTPFLRRVIFFLGRIILFFVKVSLLLLGLIALPVLGFAIFLWVIDDGTENTATQIFGFENYDELRAVSKSIDLSTDEKTLRLSDSLSTTNFWDSSYSESTPKELLEEKSLIASSKWGGIDRVHTGLFKLSQKSTKSLVKRLDIKFSKSEQDSDIIEYKEKEICLNHTDLDNHSYWLVSNQNKKDFFEFCLNSRDVEKMKWGLTIHWGENSGFSSIGVTHYFGTPFFIVSHGSS